MKKSITLLNLLIVFLLAAGCAQREEPTPVGGWVKDQDNPVLGGSYGTIFDVALTRSSNNKLFLYSSWRPKHSIALSESTDGLAWSEPVVCLENDNSSGWENEVNRPSILVLDGIYHMWYTGQNKTESYIGYATSKDGRKFSRVTQEPVLRPDAPWEKTSVMCPNVLYDTLTRQFKMWYSGGAQFEPDAIGYATSKDGITWEKQNSNPVFESKPEMAWEQMKVTAAQVIKRESDYLMFYIGFENIDLARIGMARSKDGISNWERFPNNPILSPGSYWDFDAVYKPFAIPNNNKWYLYYNGRRKDKEQIGLAVHDGLNLEF